MRTPTVVLHTFRVSGDMEGVSGACRGVCGAGDLLPSRPFARGAGLDLRTRGPPRCAAPGPATPARVARVPSV